MNNHRSECCYCQEKILSRNIGSHILRKHEESLFDNLNRSYLWYETSLTKPVKLRINKEIYYFCFADNSCIRKEITATSHFKGREEQHKEGVLRLREKYSRPSTDPSKEPLVAQSLFDDKASKNIQDIIAGMLYTIRCYENEKEKDELFESFEESNRKNLLALSKYNIQVDEESLKKLYPFRYSEPKTEVKEPEPEVYIPPKPKTEWERFVASRPDLTTDDERIAEAKEMGFPIPPELLSSVVVKPVPVAKEEPIVYIPPKRTPWEMFVLANPHLTTDAERIAEAREMGFPIPPELLPPVVKPQPKPSAEIQALMYHMNSIKNTETQQPFGNLVTNTKTKRPPKAVDSK